MSLQSKLLRVLQEKKVRRIGENLPRPVDVRVLAATHCDLAAMVKNNLFREDLYYRLNVIPVFIPPLRERKEDILAMAQFFLANNCERYGKKKEFHSKLIPVLLDYSWPGNVRELENIIERLFVTSPGTVITLQDLPVDLLRASSQPSMFPPLIPEGKDLKQIMSNLEASIINHAVLQHKTTYKVAQALGINQSNVVRKMCRYGIKPFGNKKTFCS
jgi:transcriptional regulator with PAS, ATPase and Fis domain